MCDIYSTVSCWPLENIIEEKGFDPIDRKSLLDSSRLRMNNPVSDEDEDESEKPQHRLIQMQPVDVDGYYELFRNNDNTEYEMVIDSKHRQSNQKFKIRSEQNISKIEGIHLNNITDNRNGSSQSSSCSLKDKREQDSLDRETDTTFSRQTASHTAQLSSNGPSTAHASVGIRCSSDNASSMSNTLSSPKGRENRTPSSGFRKSFSSPNITGLRKKLFQGSLGRANKWKIENHQIDSKSKAMYIDDSALVELCGIRFNSPSDVQIALERDPSLAEQNCINGRFALHAVCAKGLPIRKAIVVALQDYSYNFESMKGVVHASPVINKHKSFLQRDDESMHSSLDRSISEAEHVLQIPLKVMKEDAQNFRDLLQIIMEANTLAAIKMDDNNDLPVHILARSLWDWGIYLRPKSRSKTRHIDEFREITQIIRECIEILLKPIVNKSEYCMIPGSKGVLLPIHIAAVFGVSFEIMEGVLNGYHVGATKRTYKALDGIENVLPIFLFENKAFFRYESNKMEIMNFERTSDLIFAFNPHILPFRRGPARLKRIQNWIIREAETHNERLCVGVELLWKWMCTFSNQEDENDNYDHSIESILNHLDNEALNKVLMIRVDEGNLMKDILIPKYGNILKEKEKHIMPPSIKRFITQNEKGLHPHKKSWVEGFNIPLFCRLNE